MNWLARLWSHCSIIDWALVINAETLCIVVEDALKDWEEAGCVVGFWILVSGPSSQNRSSRGIRRVKRWWREVKPRPSDHPLAPEPPTSSASLTTALVNVDIKRFCFLRAADPLRLRELNEFPFRNTFLATAPINVGLTPTQPYNTRLVTFCRACRSHKGSVVP